MSVPNKRLIRHIIICPASLNIGADGAVINTENINEATIISKPRNISLYALFDFRFE